MSEAHPGPAGGAQAKPAPPPTHNRPVGSATHCCPLQALKPCDPTSLELEVKILGENEGERKLTTDKVRRNEPLPATLKDRTVRDLLSRYDLVIDVIAGYPSRELMMPRDRVKVRVKGKWLGPCADHAHPTLWLKPINYKAPDWAREMSKQVGQRAPEFAREFVTKAAEVKLTEVKYGIQLERQAVVKHEPGKTELELPADHDYVANPIASDFAEGAGRLTVIIDVMRALWPTLTPAILEVGAVSCGKRKPGETPNKNLNGAVRIFRKETIAVGFKIPALGCFKHERSGMVTGMGTDHQQVEHSQTTTKKAVILFDDKEHRGAWTDTTTKETTGGKLMQWSGANHGTPEQTVSRRGDGPTGAETTRLQRIRAELDKYEIGIVLKRNGREIDFLEPPEATKLDKQAHPTLASAQHRGGQLAGKIQNKKLRDVVIAGLSGGVKSLAALLDTIKKMPQMGWKFELECSLFAGEIVGEWGPDYVTDPVVPGRYYGVEMMVHLKIACDIIAFKVALSFGIEFKAVGTGVCIKAVGSLSLRLPVALDVVLSLKRKPMAEIKVKPEGRVAIDVVANASALGWSVADCRGGIGIGFAMDNGVLKVSLSKGPDLVGTLKWTPLEVYYWLRGPTKPPKEPHVKQLWPGCVIKEFKENPTV
jgi:hypothetical protein